MLAEVRTDLRRQSRPAKAKILSGFFKTGKGQYGEGDRFIGVVMPDIRRVVLRFADELSFSETMQLSVSPIHEERMCALLILVRKFQRGDAILRKKIYHAYLNNARYINNWDLVDLTAPQIIGAYLDERSKTVLTKLAKSKSLWERRIAVLSTFYYIYQGKSSETLKIARILLKDEHDLIHKAVGWMLREVGKRCSVQELEKFLQKNAGRMPRTMLRYAIERFPENQRQAYLKQ